VRILFATSEALPYYKTGGLADVARALPDALVQRGHDVRILLPGYGLLDRALAGLEPTGRLAVPWPLGGRSAELVLDATGSGAAAVFVREPTFFDTATPYEPVPGDALSLGRRFAFFSRAVAAYSRAWAADVVHLNDWQTGLVPVYGLIDGIDAATVFAIHNLAYQGNFPAALLAQVGVPADFFRVENGLEFYGQASFMKVVLALADRLVTVSPTYAEEIRSPAFGAGLHGLLQHRRRVLHGVLNGIDTAAWNPLTDPLLPAPYNVRTIAQKDVSRAALLDAAGIDGDGPVLGMVSRLAHQKGVDLLLAALPELVRRGCRVVILGAGDTALEHAIATLAADSPDRVVLRTGFDEPFAHLVYAGADFFLMPSLYEPCGLGQMIAQRYGTPPIARRTGGLADTVQDGVTGFLFDEPSAAAMLAAADRALRLWGRRGWRAMQTRCMREDRSWTRSAALYERVYELAIGGPALLAH
jgi:starch synthase